jgi:UDP-N-acetylglucosamine 2-epimerase
LYSIAKSVRAGLLDGLGTIVLDTTRPNGQPRRKVDIARAETSFGFGALTLEPASGRRIDGNPVIGASLVAVDAPCDPGSGPLKGMLWDWRLTLVTAHRRETPDGSLDQVCHAFRDVVLHYAGDAEIIYTVHLNPNVQEQVWRILGKVPGVTVAIPLGCLPLVYLMTRVTPVLTDSSGVQEEAPGLGKLLLVLR